MTTRPQNGTLAHWPSWALALAGIMATCSAVVGKPVFANKSSRSVASASSSDGGANGFVCSGLGSTIASPPSLDLMAPRKAEALSRIAVSAFELLGVSPPTRSKCGTLVGGLNAPAALEATGRPPSTGCPKPLEPAEPVASPPPPKFRSTSGPSSPSSASSNSGSWRGPSCSSVVRRRLATHPSGMHTSPAKLAVADSIVGRGTGFAIATIGFGAEACVAEATVPKSKLKATKRLRVKTIPPRSISELAAKATMSLCCNRRSSVPWRMNSPFNSKPFSDKHER
mmetsp:Transcript_40261/g.110764  ORF Transcript_40261/g.110764 Transcript_40261/m.110764 type:complete len:283 (+) Transcript_40261:70-918(+)